MLWQFVRASYFFRLAAWIAFWGLLPATYGITTFIQVHRRLQGYYSVRARVIEKVKIGSELEPCVRVEYRTVQGRLEHSDLSLSTPEEHALAPGDETQVYVSEADPSDAWFLTHGVPGYSGVRIAAALTLLLLLPALVAFVQEKRRVAVLLSGQPTMGRVKKVVREKSSHFRSPYDYFVIYGYTTPSGLSFEGRSPNIRKSQADRCRKTAQIPVYFDLERPERSEADVYGFRNAPAAGDGAL